MLQSPQQQKQGQRQKQRRQEKQERPKQQILTREQIVQQLQALHSSGLLCRMMVPGIHVSHKVAPAATAAAGWPRTRERLWCWHVRNQVMTACKIVQLLVGWRPWCSGHRLNQHRHFLLPPV